MSEKYEVIPPDKDTAFASIKTLMVDGQPTDLVRHYLIPEHFPELSKEAIDSRLTKEWDIFMLDNGNQEIPRNGKVGYYVQIKLGDEMDKAIASYKRKQSGFDYKL